MLLWTKKRLIWRFLKIFAVRLCEKINFENLKKSPRKHQEGGILEDSYSHEKFIENFE